MWETNSHKFNTRRVKVNYHNHCEAISYIILFLPKIQISTADDQTAETSIGSKKTRLFFPYPILPFR